MPEPIEMAYDLHEDGVGSMVKYGKKYGSFSCTLMHYAMFIINIYLVSETSKSEFHPICFRSCQGLKLYCISSPTKK